MIKDKLPDGFPVGSDVDPSENYPCDNCGERFDANEEGILADATGSNGEYHKYAFCSYDCTCDFAEDNDLLIDRYPDGPVDVKFTLGRNGQTDDPVAAAEDDGKPKHKLCADGFPDENHTHNGIYDCDNCGLGTDFNKGYRVDAVSDDGEHDLLHMYSFCDEKCAEEFAARYGLVMVEATDEDHDKSVNTDFTFKHDPVAAAVKSINVGGVSTDRATDGATDELEPVPEELVQETVTAEAQRQETGFHERKVLQVWDRVVSNAQEIAQLASEIEEKNNELKALKKDYESLVKRQNTYILQNGDGIQTTFADLDSPADPQPETDAEADAKPDAEAETPDSDAETVDSLAWRDEPVTTLANYGLTEKQADKAQEAFGTLGRLQDWLCADYRDKQPGIGQALQNKLTDALNKYTDTIYTAGD